MSDTTCQNDGRVLWVRPTVSPLGTPVGKTARIEDTLTRASDSVLVVEDVYHALVKLARADAHRISAAVVCVDAVDPEELAFFTLLARRRNVPPSYVYGHERSLAKLGRAIEMGATGEADVDLIEQLTMRPPAPNDAAVPHEPTEDPSALTGSLPSGPVFETVVPAVDDRYESFDPLSFQEHCDSDETADAQVGEADGATTDAADEPTPAPEQAEPDAPARVPWRQYGGRPPRQAPQRTPPPASPAADEREADSDPDDLHQPLLTEEELRALIGNDPTPPSPKDVNQQRDRP